MWWIRFSTFTCLILLLTFAVTESNAACGSMPLATRERLYKSVVALSVGRNGSVDQGSGVIVSTRGYILTNHHVVDDAKEITVSIYTGEDTAPSARYLAEVVMSNSNSDIAVLEITSTTNGASVSASTLRSALSPLTTYAELASDDSVRVIGYSLMGRGTILNTRGDIGGTNSVPMGARRGKVYLTDAVMGAGGSGGLVVNCDGVMVGIPAEVRGNDGRLAVVLPISTICSVEPQVCDNYIDAEEGEEQSSGCPNNGLPPRLVIGQRARVTLYPDKANRVRSSPGTDARILDNIEPGQRFRVLEGPVCEDNINWWKIRVNSSGLEGWTAEGADREYYTEPIGG